MDVLKILEASKNDYLSGEVIAKKLTMSRANVWKEIDKLRKQGYCIDATPSLGYKLVSYNENISKSLLEDKLSNLSVEVYEQLKSSNDLAKEKNQINRLIITKSQSHGRGRMGKSFYSPKDKGLYFSYVINPDIELHLIPLITIAAALAVNKALPIKTDIKWLNDILFENKKIAGILVEGDIELQSRRFNKIIVGVGVNLFASDIPNDLKDIMASVENFSSEEIDRHQILIDFIEEFDQRVIEIKENSDNLIKDYRNLCVTLNKNIVYKDKVYKAVDINESGHLIVEDLYGKQLVIQSGEVCDQN